MLLIQREHQVALPHSRPFNPPTRAKKVTTYVPLPLPHSLPQVQGSTDYLIQPTHDGRGVLLEHRRLHLISRRMWQSWVLCSAQSASVSTGLGHYNLSPNSYSFSTSQLRGSLHRRTCPSAPPNLIVLIVCPHQHPTVPSFECKLGAAETA